MRTLVRGWLIASGRLASGHVALGDALDVLCQLVEALIDRSKIAGLVVGTGVGVGRGFASEAHDFGRMKDA